MGFTELFIAIPSFILIMSPLLLFLLWIISVDLRSFSYPYFIVKFDVSRKRNVDIYDHIDRYLSKESNVARMQAHIPKVEAWKNAQMEKLEHAKLFRRSRMKSFLASIDDEHMFRFVTVRERTKYRQRNYVRTPYKEFVDDVTVGMSWEEVRNRRERLAKIGFETSLPKYNAHDQRKLMTRELRKQIMERDNYTCQTCGKYMPDEVGLHIDHIVPISRGGKSVPSNLQVLCDKCNLSKGSK